jgi:hypothetical protein
MRCSRTAFVFFTLSWFFSTSLCAQQSTSANVQASQWVHQSSAALNPTGAPIRDVTLTGSAHRIAGSDQETGTVVLKALATGEARADFSYPSGPRSEVYGNSDKGPVGGWSGPDGTLKPIPLYNALVDSAWFSPALLLSKAGGSPDTVASTVANETRNGLAVEHIAISKQFPRAPSQVSALMQRDSQTQVYVDLSSSLPVAVSFNMHPDNDDSRNIPIEIQFSDYRVVNGVQIPFHIQKYMNNSLILDLQIQKVDLNTGLNSSAFSVPSPTIRSGPPLYKKGR